MKSFAGVLAAFLVVFVVGATSGFAGVLIHQAWWGLALALGAAAASLMWLPAGAMRLAFALGWVVPVMRGSLPLPAGDVLIASTAAGWTFLGGSFVLLLSALVSMGGRSRRASDPGLRGSAT